MEKKTNSGTFGKLIAVINGLLGAIIYAEWVRKNELMC